MTKLNAYLTFDGLCEAAFRHYATLLGGEIVSLMRWRDAPGMGEGGTMPADWLDKVMHAELAVDGARLMGGDPPPAHRQVPAGMSVALLVATPEEADRVFHGLTEGAAIAMPMQQTFWSRRFGMLTDRFGTPWIINCEAAP